MKDPLSELGRSLVRIIGTFVGSLLGLVFGLVLGGIPAVLFSMMPKNQGAGIGVMLIALFTFFAIAPGAASKGGLFGESFGERLYNRSRRASFTAKHLPSPQDSNPYASFGSE